MNEEIDFLRRQVEALQKKNQELTETIEQLEQELAIKGSVP